MKRCSSRRWLALTLAGWSLVACASLPNVDPDKTRQSAAATPVVKSVNGSVSPEREPTTLSSSSASS